jgi:hypothetical protein
MVTRASKVAMRLAYVITYTVACLAEASILVTKLVPTGAVMRNADPEEFCLAEKGMTRFPPNVEQISIEHAATVTWLIARRNEVVLRFPLREVDRKHLAQLLLGETLKL